MRHSLRDRLSQGQSVLGAALQIDSPWLVEMLGAAGFNYVLLDGEHGFALNNLPLLILAADAAGIAPIVRVPSHERGWLIQALEAGAVGVQVPMVNTVEQAVALVHEVKYGPLGGRGYSRATRAAGYGAISRDQLAAAANRQTMLIIHIETQEALANSQAMAQVPGVDVLFFGPDDLAQSMGYVGQAGGEAVRELIQQAIAPVRGRLPIGISTFSAAETEFWHTQGVQYFLTASTNPIRLALEGVRREIGAGLGRET